MQERLMRWGHCIPPANRFEDDGYSRRIGAGEPPAPELANVHQIQAVMRLWLKRWRRLESLGVNDRISDSSEVDCFKTVAKTVMSFIRVGHQVETGLERRSPTRLDPKIVFTLQCSGGTS